MSATQNSTREERTPTVNPGNYSPVTVKDTIGSVFLGILSIILLIGWMRAETRLRDLLIQSRSER